MSGAALSRFIRTIRTHGNVRGANSVPESETHEGRFGRMFRGLPAAKFSDSALQALATQMIAPADPATPETQADDEENTAISAGYTYLGQFIDHDLTFDPASSLQKQNDPNALVDYRTPRFDLDCVYGRGPDDQPYLYLDDGLHMQLGSVLTGNVNDPKARQIPRANPSSGAKRGLIGDPRNDENGIVSQLQSAMLRFHNRSVDYLTARDGKAPAFEDAQRFVRWHYQWVVLYDFLPTIIGQDMLKRLLPHLAKGTTTQQDPPHLKFFHPKNDSFMPIEFSAAAYRFGHSMVRPIYRINTTIPDRFVIFPDLAGFEEFPSNRAIDWSLYFAFGGAPPLGPTRVQPAYKIDTSLVNPLGNLPAPIAHDPSSLALRNLLRGRSMSLPSGQTVAHAMGVKPIKDAALKIGKATEDAIANNEQIPIVSIDSDFKGDAPLWVYVLAEAQQSLVHNGDPIRLGEVGGRIVGETFVGLMYEDRQSFLRQAPGWAPEPAFTNGGLFTMVELLKQSMQA